MFIITRLFILCIDLNHRFNDLIQLIQFFCVQADLIKFMGPKNVATVKHKMLSILTTAYQIKDKEDLEGSNFKICNRRYANGLKTHGTGSLTFFSKIFGIDS